MEAADIDDLSGLLAQTENDRRSEQTSTSEDDHDLAHQRHQEDEEHEKDPPIAAIEPRVSLESDHQVSTPPAVAQNTPGFAPPEEGVLEGVLSSDSITSGGGGDELFQRSGSPAIVDDSDTNGGDGNDELQVGEESAYPTGSDPQGPEEAPDSLAKDTDEQSHPEESVGDVLGDDEGSDANTAHVPEERGNLDAAEAVSVPGTGEGWHLDSSDSAPPPGENRGDGGGFLPGTVAGLRDGGLLADDSFDRSMSFAEDDDDHHHDHDHDQTPSDILRHIDPTMSGRDREAQAVIDALQDVYREKLRPIEELSMFDMFHHDVMSDADLQAKPQVLLLGQYSTGKTSMIRHFIGQDFPGMQIGPEPSKGVFNVVTAGTEERTIKGSALCIVDELPYSGLGKFGAPFLGKFQASLSPSPLLEHINFVDTPGILSGERHGGTRGYPFPEVVKWFADRSDMILLVFDAHKLDMGEEFREVMKAIADHGDRVRVVLNKAQEVDGDRLVKVYGALMWSIGRCLRGKANAPKVYVGSFWDGPRRHPDDSPDDIDDDSFDVDEASLRREMLELPKNVGVRKINDMMQRAKLVKIHLEIVYAIKDRMPRLWGAEAAQCRILASLEEVFDEVKMKRGVHDADMPKVDVYRRDLERVDFRDLPRRNRRLLLTVDDIINRDIKQCITRAGGVRRIYKLDSAARLGGLVTSSSSSSSRRRATMGGGVLRRPGTSIFSRESSSGSPQVRARRASGDGEDQLERWPKSPRVRDLTEDYGQEDDDDHMVLPGGGVVDDDGEGGGTGAKENEVPFLMGTLAMVMVVLMGVAAGLWKMDALPAVQDWVVSFNPSSPSR